MWFEEVTICGTQPLPYAKKVLVVQLLGLPMFEVSLLTANLCMSCSRISGQGNWDAVSINIERL